MNSSVKAILSFIAGLGIGAGAMYVLVNDRCEARADQEIESIKEMYRERDKKEEEKKKKQEVKLDKFNEAIAASNAVDTHAIDYSHPPTMPKEEEESEEPYEEEDDDIYDDPPAPDGPYIINRAEYYGTKTNYGKQTWTCYADGIITDENDAELDDYIPYIGTCPERCFGTSVAEGDSVYFRNDQLRVDIELQQDSRIFEAAKEF